MGAGAIHGQKKAERPGTASLLEVNHFGDVTKMICPCSPFPDAHLASGSSFLAGMHSTFPAVIRSPGPQSRASQMLRTMESVTVS